MSKLTEQMKTWADSFGQEYTDRNAMSLEEMEVLYKSQYGLTRSELNRSFLEGIDRSIRILEVGSNVGNQLLCLQQLGFHNLYGIELQSYAVELAKSRTKRINIIEGSAFDIPYKDGFFDLVFTSGVLIQISPADIVEALQEIHRCSNHYIWGLEYYASDYTEIKYRNNEGLLWKTDFAKLYLDTFTDLVLVKEQQLPYLDSENTDSMYLLKKV